jgi:hypothetical protein
VLSGDWRRAEAVAADRLGNTYVLDRDARQVYMYSAAGEETGVIGPSLSDGIQLRRPEDLAVDGSGRLLIADRDVRALIVLE